MVSVVAHAYVFSYVGVSTGTMVFIYYFTTVNCCTVQFGAQASPPVLHSPRASHLSIVHSEPQCLFHAGVAALSRIMNNSIPGGTILTIKRRMRQREIG